MKQSEIWLINLDPTIGAEIKKTRPAVIGNDDALGKLPLKVIVPLTDWKERYSTPTWMIKIEPDSKNGLSKASAADCFQIRFISDKRFVRRLGHITPDEHELIKSGISSVLSLTSE